jgi:hypothetical protein
MSTKSFNPAIWEMAGDFVYEGYEQALKDVFGVGQIPEYYFALARRAAWLAAKRHIQDYQGEFDELIKDTEQEAKRTYILEHFKASTRH